MPLFYVKVVKSHSHLDPQIPVNPGIFLVCAISVVRWLYKIAP